MVDGVQQAATSWLPEGENSGRFTVHSALTFVRTVQTYFVPQTEIGGYQRR